jgi:hypothetical protein
MGIRAALLTYVRLLLLAFAVGSTFLPLGPGNC